MISTEKVLALQVPGVGVESVALGAAVGAGGGVAVPGLLISVDVVWRPVASRIENVNGSTQVPLVMARKKPPVALTIELTSVDRRWEC